MRTGRECPLTPRITLVRRGCHGNHGGGEGGGHCTARSETRGLSIPSLTWRCHPAALALMACDASAGRWQQTKPRWTGAPRFILCLSGLEAWTRDDEVKSTTHRKTARKLVREGGTTGEHIQKKRKSPHPQAQARPGKEAQRRHWKAEKQRAGGAAQNAERGKTRRGERKEVLHTEVATREKSDAERRGGQQHGTQWERGRSTAHFKKHTNRPWSAHTDAPSTANGEKKNRQRGERSEEGKEGRRWTKTHTQARTYAHAPQHSHAASHTVWYTRGVEKGMRAGRGARHT